jgi:hypothetical protein
MERPDRLKYKELVGLSGKKVVLTFGLLSPNKGIEHAIRAMAMVAQAHPDVCYVVLGQTHPGIIRDHGESYRNSLVHLAAEVGILNNVLFLDYFVTIEDLKKYIAASDIYLTPYLHEQQITSGTLSYAFGMGSAVVSTPYWHATELLADGRGYIVPFRDPQRMGETVVMLLSDDALRERVQANAFDYGRSMTWPATAAKYREVFTEALEHYADELTEPSSPVTPLVTGFAMQSTSKLPALNLAHLRRLTDDVAILQHCKFSVPDRSQGYSLDVVSRALNLLMQFRRHQIEIDPRVKEFSAVYLAFIQHAFIPEQQRFHNFMSYSRTWLDEIGSEDSHGRTMQALAACVRFGLHYGCANELFLYAMTRVAEFTSPRAWAYSLIGLRDYVAATGHIEARQLMIDISQKLLGRFESCAGDAKWPWPEDVCTYDNAILPQALICCGRVLGNDAMRSLGERVLIWLFHKEIADDKFSPIGNRGWMTKSGQHAVFDQQSIEAGSVTLSCVSAFHATGDHNWYNRARVAFDWYMGRNALGKALYDPSNGGCYDALHENRLNLNMGAESLLMFLQALAALLAAEREVGEVNPLSLIEAK